MVRSLAAAARWIDRTGLALLFPKADVVLPSLWEAINGSPETNWAVREPDGTFVSWTKELALLWSVKDELPEQGLACVGKHVGRVATCVAPRLLPTLVAANAEPADDGDPVVEAITALGPLTSPRLREATGLTKKEVDRSVAALHRRLVLTNDRLVEEDAGWGALAHDLLARKWRLPKRLPARDGARRELAALVLAGAGELTAADLRGAFGWRSKEAREVLDGIAESREEDGFRIWAAP